MTGRLIRKRGLSASGKLIHAAYKISNEFVGLGGWSVIVMFGARALSIRLAKPDHLLQRARETREHARGALDFAQRLGPRLKLRDDVRDGREFAFDHAPDALGLRQGIVEDRLIRRLLGGGRLGRHRLEPVGQARPPAPLAPARLEGGRADAEKRRDVLVELVGLFVAASPFGDLLRRNVNVFQFGHGLFSRAATGRVEAVENGRHALRRLRNRGGISLKTQLWSVPMSYRRSDSLSSAKS